MVMAPLTLSMRVFHSRLALNESELVPNTRDFVGDTVDRGTDNRDTVHRDTVNRGSIVKAKRTENSV